MKFDSDSFFITVCSMLHRREGLFLRVTDCVVLFVLSVGFLVLLYTFCCLTNKDVHISTYLRTL